MNSPYICLKKGLFCRLYIKVDIVLINEKITKIKSQLSDAITPRQIKLNKMLNLCYKNREFIIRQLNQQMLERGKQSC